MQLHIIKPLAALAIGAMLLTGCMVEKPTVKNYRRVSAMPELTPVTVEQLRQLIAADTTHYKVVVLTSPCCGTVC
jgi:PBP1b-binding outer membrane lipoprotein LpoB